MNDFLMINMAGKNSGALLLTILGLTHRHRDERFTQKTRASAVQDDNPPADWRKPT